MALVLRATGDVPGAPAYIDFAQAFAADPRVVGVWRCEDAYATFSGDDVATIANLKTGGADLLPIGGNAASMAFDEVLAKNVLHFESADRASAYGVALDLSALTDFTFFAFHRATAAADYSGFSYLFSTDTNTNVPVLRHDLSATPQFYPVAAGVIGASSAVTLVLKDPYGWTESTYYRGQDKGIAIEVRGVGTVAGATAIDPGATGYAQIGHASQARTPTANVAVYAVLNVDLRRAPHADLRVLFEAFKREACAV